MIPIRDVNRSEAYPIINNLLIALNVLVFITELSQGRGLGEFIYMYGLVPARYSIPRISALFTTGQQVVPFITFMFLHGGFLHLIGNMWFLYLFGDNIEDRLGHFRYLAFYFVCGLSSGISHLLLNWHSQVPTIGASGAIAGVMGAYLVLFPRARILTLIPIFFIPYFVEVPAFLFLGVWLLFQFVSAAGASAQAGGIAWWAHIGGFIFGIVFLKLFERLPDLGADRKVRTYTKKRSTPRLQVIRPTSVGDDDPNLYGVIAVNAREAASGARKLVNIGRGARKKAFFIKVPPDVSEGTVLRLKGLGRRTINGREGDLYLKVQIKD